MFSGSECEKVRVQRMATVCARAYAAGRSAMARRDYDLARTAFRWARRADPGNPVYIHAEALLAERVGNPHEAERLFLRVIDVARRAFGAGDPRTAMVQGNLVRLYERMGRLDEARELAATIVGGLDRRAAAQGTVNGLSRIADICIRAGRADDAMLIHWQAVSARRTVFGHGHAKVTEILAATNALAARLQRTSAADAGTRQAGRPTKQAPVPVPDRLAARPEPQPLQA